MFGIKEPQKNDNKTYLQSMICQSRPGWATPTLFYCWVSVLLPNTEAALIYLVWWYQLSTISILR